MTAQNLCVFLFILTVAAGGATFMFFMSSRKHTSACITIAATSAALFLLCSVKAYLDEPEHVAWAAMLLSFSLAYAGPIAWHMIRKSQH